MLAYTSANKKLKIANCTNHNITFFNSYFLTEDRRNNYCFFNNENDIEVAKVEVIHQLKPLSVREYQTEHVIENDGIKFFQPSVYYCSVDELSGYFNYDVIVVSAKYANAAILKIQNADYLDRLVIPSKLVYNKNPKLYYDAKVIGCIGVQKVYSPFNLTQYASMIGTGITPSKISMYLMRDLYIKLPNRYEISQQSSEENSLNIVNTYLSQFGFASVPTLFSMNSNQGF